MGSGSSARKAADVAAEAAAEDLRLGSFQAFEGARSKYKVPGVIEYHSGGSESDGGDGYVPKLRPCDRCSEERKCARCGGGCWLCVVCQLEAPEEDQKSRPKPRRLSLGMTAEKPQPLRRGHTTDLSAFSGHSSPDADRTRGVRRTKRDRIEGGDVLGTPGAEGGDAEGRSGRRGAKDRTAPAALDPAGQGLSSHGSLSIVQERQDYRSVKGLNELRGSIHRSSSSLSASDDEVEGKGEKSQPPVPIEAKKKKRLLGGFFLGDRVVSLITRARRGLQVLELGNQGTVVGARGDDDSGAEVRLLVQFDGGVDWFLAPGQICHSSALKDAKSAGLARFNWGTRVRSLVTYMLPQGTKKSIWLGHYGTVIGPGRTPGKLAVRFDDSCCEWSIWPSSLCEDSAFQVHVQEKLAGGYCRGDRVRAARATGAGSCSGSPLTLNEGEEGTVVGPGHMSGRLLVHFDNDQHTWSLTPEQISS